MAQGDENKTFERGGLNTDDAPEYVSPTDFTNAVNISTTGTGLQTGGYITNLPSTTLIPDDLPSGIDNVIGGGKFEDVGLVVFWRYSTSGQNQIGVYNTNTKVLTTPFTDIINTSGQVLMPLNPQNEVMCFLVNGTFLIWWAKGLEVGYTNLNTLMAGGYGTFTYEDLSLLKPQCLIPPIWTFGSDAGQPANDLYSNLAQFSVAWIGFDYNYSAISTYSQRAVPYQENTPIGGANVTNNNYLIISVSAGTIRVMTINVLCRFGLDIFSVIKSVDRSYVIALPNTSVDVDNEIYEAYDPSTNVYSFAFYNNELTVPVDPTYAALLYDYIWPSNAGSLLNGNIAAIGDWTTLYARPTTSVTVNAGGYNPNIAIPAGTFPNELTMSNKQYGQSGSGEGDHKRLMYFTLSGTPHTGDVVNIVDVSIQDATNTHNYNYNVPSSQDGDLLAVVQTVQQKLPRSSYTDNGDGTYTIYWVDDPYFGAQTLGIELNFGGATVSNSIPTILDNCPYQLALAYYDKYGRPFPLRTDSAFQLTTPSKAQVSTNGSDPNAIEIQWTINDVSAPVGAVTYQWVISQPPVPSLCETIATLIAYQGSWDAKTNTPTLGQGAGASTVGFAYQITTPCAPSDTANYHNLGNNATYNTGDYVVFNGLSWDVIPGTIGDLTSTGNIVAFSLIPLKLYNDNYSKQGVTTIVGYSYSIGDRCTLDYYIDSGANTFINNPCVDLSVLGYDAGNYIVKLEKSSTFDIATELAGKNTFLRLYNPGLQTEQSSSVQNETVYNEIGKRYTITNGNHDTLNDIITDGGAYFKTRQFLDGLSPYSSPPIETLATDLNYSDFYPSAYYSFGRTRTYYDVLEQTEQKASVVTSQPYVLGSKNNGLNRVYPQTIYGDSNGQVSSAQGAIQIMWQRGNTLVFVQEQDVFYAPVNTAYTQVNDQVTQISISMKLLNNGEYSINDVGIGFAKESFCTRFGKAFFISPEKSEPFEIDTTAGVVPISAKMSKYFKQIIQVAYAEGKKLRMFYDDYNEKVVLCIQSPNGILTYFAFDDVNWQVLDGYSIAPTDVTSTPNSTHAVAAYNTGTGILTYTPSPGYIGGDTGMVTFNVAGVGSVSKNACLTWIAGDDTPNNFSFTPLIDQLLSTTVFSNTISVGGINIPAAISVTGGEYSVNGGAFTSSPGFVNNGDTVQVNNLSSASPSTLTSTTLTISGVSATFDVTTRATPTDNFQLYANYGMTMTEVQDGSSTGVPPAFSVISLPPGSYMYAAYTTITAGTIRVFLTGTPSIPGHVQVSLVIGGVTVSSVPLVGPGDDVLLTVPSDTNDPTFISINVNLY